MMLTMLTMSPLLVLLLTLWMMLTVPMGLCGLWWPPARPSWTQVPPLVQDLQASAAGDNHRRVGVGR